MCLYFNLNICSRVYIIPIFRIFAVCLFHKYKFFFDILLLKTRNNIFHFNKNWPCQFNYLTAYCFIYRNIWTYCINVYIYVSTYKILTLYLDVGNSETHKILKQFLLSATGKKTKQLATNTFILHMNSCTTNLPHLWFFLWFYSSTWFLKI